MIMNLPTIQQSSAGGMTVVQTQPGTTQQLQQIPPQVHQAQEKLDNISKVKSLVAPLREALTVTLKTAAHTFHQNSIIDVGSQKVDATVPRFDKSMEEFYSICDQIELHLKTSIECVTQGASSHRYLPIPIALTRTEPLPSQESGTLTYPQYLATVRTQVAYTREVHDTLVTAANSMSPGE